MAFNDANLVLTGTGVIPETGVKSLAYSTGDNLATVFGGTYFDSAARSLRIGDMINVTASDGKVLCEISDVTVSPSVSVRQLALVTTFYL
jgi:hypothetical protein